jgi:hypothetical protein
MQPGYLVVAGRGKSYLLNAAIHVNTAVFASMTLDSSALIHDMKLILIRGDLHLVDLDGIDERAVH